MITLKALTNYLDEQLNVAAFGHDYSNNGLQVEGNASVRRAVFGVDASLALFEAAAELQADFIFVHHGLSWSAEPRRLTGLVARRYRTLFINNLSLYAVHLPLDAHPRFGNNAVLADRVGLIDRRMFFQYAGSDIGILGRLPETAAAEALARTLQHHLGGTPPQVFAGDRPVRRVAVISGGAGLDGLQCAIDAGAELLITGEIEHTMFHLIAESGIAVIGLGHYRSETTGVQAIRQLLQQEFGLIGHFVDLPTGL
ncbi:Nif3-like dinuclear metal center hexameric protein [Victivallis sp. Marseille-Q1083]|uniref:Nif3-like dinuclear metal center hexameric protein n=1 Tax=Victivallis sp. Marseille-Q1083 TaxID=2717288 RepID=UPI00158BEF7A|nr:Nif3-like dinuclear metal center hexameric protein [Victivallis sp. Marseille-Q1083]